MRLCANVDRGGAVFAVDGSNIIVKTSVFESNSGNVGGGAVYASSSSTVTVTKSTFAFHAAWYGGAIYVKYSLLTVAACVFESNTASIAYDVRRC